MRTLTAILKKWPESHGSVRSDTKNEKEQCEEKCYQLEPAFRALVNSTNCARYVLKPEQPAYYPLTVRLTGGVSTELKEGLQSILDDLYALNRNEDVEGYVFKPEVRAFRVAEFYIKKVYAKMGAQFPSPSFIPDGEGGIDVEWSDGENEVTLSCRANDEQEDFLYIKKGGVRYTELDLSSTKLFKHLKELNNA